MWIISKKIESGESIYLMGYWFTKDGYINTNWARFSFLARRYRFLGHAKNAIDKLRNAGITGTLRITKGDFNQ